MPLLRIHTNLDLPRDQQASLLATASRLMADQLGKPERYVMVSMEHNPAMLFAGEDAPLAYLELKSIGLSSDSTGDLSRTLCELIHGALGIDQDRIYIEFSDAPRQMWGWNGGTF